MNAPYIPSGGLSGKLARLSARIRARRPITAEIDRPMVSVTFDDFPRSAAETAAPELERRGWRATWYAACGFEGTENHLGALFTGEDIKRLTAAGHEIGCHTYAHGDAARMEPAALLADCARNRTQLAGMGVSGPLHSFAFPYGEASAPAKTALSGEYRALRGVWPGINRRGDDLNLLKAVGLDGGEAGLDAALSRIAELGEQPGWLIFYGHDVRRTPSEWGCTPDHFKTVCEAIEASGADMLTVGAALDRLEAA